MPSTELISSLLELTVWEGDRRCLSPSSITVICAEIGVLALIRVCAGGAQMSDLESQGGREAYVQS